MSDAGIGISTEGVPPLEPLTDLPPDWRPPPPAPPPAPVVLSGIGADSIRRLLEVEGAIVHSLRCPDGPPDAWVWTPEEIDQLMPALTAVADRYGATGLINANGPYLVAMATVGAHVGRSLGAERAWNAIDTVVPSTPDQEPQHEPTPTAAATAESGGTGDEPPAGLGRESIDRLSRALSPAGGPLGPRT